jgi:hypothetical protein
MMSLSSRWGSFSFRVNFVQVFIHPKIASEGRLRRVVKAVQRQISPIALGDGIVIEQ